MSSVIDIMLHRELRSGKEFEGLIPPSTHTQQYFEKENEWSDTYETLQFMALWANKYAYQMQKVAPLLKGATLNKTVDNIYQWLYNHFQYKIDGQLQQLYAPSAAWENRFTGFDCKTYSLLASTLLQCLSIPHAFRKIKQPGMMPDEWTHVYVIVPTQNNKYLVIDATTHDNKEVSKIEKYDYTMKLKHVGLASPAVVMARPFENYGGLACPGTECTCGQGLSGTYGAYGFDMNSLYGDPTLQNYGLGAIVWNDIKNFPTSLTPVSPNASNSGELSFNSIGQITSGGFSFQTIKNAWAVFKSAFGTPVACWGGSAFSGNIVNVTTEAIAKWLNYIIVEMNIAVAKNDTERISDLDVMFRMYTHCLAASYESTLAKGWNPCTTDSLKNVLNLVYHYKNVVHRIYSDWIANYYTITNGENFTVDSTMFGGQPTWFEMSNPNPTYLEWKVPVRKFIMKPTTQVIKAFEFTPYVQQVGGNAMSGYTISDYISKANTILKTVQQVSTGVSNNGSGTATTDGGTYDATTGAYIPPKEKSTTTASKAGVGLLVGGVLLYAAYQIATSKEPLKPGKNAK